MLSQNNLTEFGKQVKIELINLQKNQKWLISEINKLGTLKVDTSFLHRVLTGKVKKSKMESLIKQILKIE